MNKNKLINKIMKETYVICGASGNTGGYIAKKLLEQNKKVRLIGRSKEKLKKLIDKGAQPFIGDLKDPNFTFSAFDGATTAYILIPPNNLARDLRKHQNDILTPILEAIKKTEIKNVVALSSVGAHLPINSGFILGLHDMEEKLKNIEGINLLILRCGYLMENTRTQINLIEKKGIAGSLILPDIKLPFVALRDIADIAFKRLMALDFTKQEIMEVLGPKDISYTEVTRILGKAMNINDLKYNHLGMEEEKEILIQYGQSDNVADSIIEFELAINSGEIYGDVKRNPENTTSTNFEEFTNEIMKPFKETHAYYQP